MQGKFHLIILAGAFLLYSISSLAQAPNLGAASTFALFTAAGAFNGDAGSTVIGDIGTNVGAFSPPGTLVGQIHVADAVSAQAANDVAVAFGSLAALTCGGVIGVTLGNGQILTPNIYCTGAATTLNNNLILDGQGNSNAIFIFQLGGALSTTTNSSITLVNGANLCNVYWQVDGAVSLGSTSFFLGTILANGAINFGTGATLSGRGLSIAGAISTNSNTVSVNLCLPPVITCPIDVTVSCMNQVPLPNTTSVGVVVSCQGAFTVTFVNDVISNQTCPNQYTIIRTYLATDACGNTASCEQTITVDDQTPPTITCPNVTLSVECPAVPTFPPATATDLCNGTPTITSADITTPSGICPQEFSVTRTWTANDGCGNTATCSRTISVTDNTAPIITCPVVISPLECPVTLLTLADATATDLCDATPVVTFADITTPSGICLQEYTLTRTWTATDDCGNASTCSRTVAIVDNTAPVITCPANVVVSCASNVPPPSPGTIITSDLCGGTVTVIQLGVDVITNQTCANRFTITRTYQATDACGNSATCAQTITVNDITPPVITCPANVNVSCASAVPPAALPGTIITSDLCGGIVTVVQLGGDVITNQTCANRFTITRTYQATDACGNSATCAQTITVNDITPPVITCPANVNVTCASAVPPAALPGTLITSDLCGGIITVIQVGGDVITNQTCANRYTITRTYRATDACGNSATCAQTITVNDITAPTITCPLPVTVVCASDVPPPNPASVVTSDNCGGVVTVTLVGDVITNQICANRFTLTRTYRATDVCGNSATCAQIITVFDNIAPIFINPPSNLTVECLLVPPPTPPMATDNCAGPVTVTLLSETQIVGICPVIYTLTRVWRAADACGNFVNVSQIITVLDTYAPQFVDFPVDVVLECDLNTNENAFQDWLDTHGGATVFDCSDITWTYTDSPLFTMPSTCGGTYQRLIRFIATDVCGNSSFQDARFTVTDQTPPTFDVPPLNIEVECVVGGAGEADLLNWLENFGYASVSDQCGSVVTSVVFINETPGCGDTYVRTYQFRATDECGNTNFVLATYAVVDNTPPVIDTCPPNQIFLTCEFSVPPPNTLGVVASDNCGPVTVTVQSITTNGVGCVYSPLSTLYTYAVTDECGNVSTCFQSFQVTDSLPPIYSGPDTITVLCVADLPGPEAALDSIRQYLVDNCYDIICIADGEAESGANWVTYCVKAKDLCANWTDKFMITFIAIGGCKPICTVPQTTWGDEAGLINGLSTTVVIDELMNQYGGVTAGKLGKTITVTSTECLQNILPGKGNTDQLSTGHHLFSTGNHCDPSSIVLNEDGTLINNVAANEIAMQLNIWYNLKFNDRSLGVQKLVALPPCLVDPVVLSKVDAAYPTVQGLLNLANNYLAGVGAFPPNFGAPLNEALINVNNYWLNCPVALPDSSTVCGSKTTIAGTLGTEMMDGFANADLKLTGLNLAGAVPQLFQVSDEQGKYQFDEAVPLHSGYTVTPTSDDMAQLNGVTTYDIVLISKHNLGLEPLNSPYKMIAADANNSGSITTFDIVELRKLILGIYDELPNNTTWRFVDKAFAFPDPANPFSTPFPQSKTVQNVLGNLLENDFVSVKIGDVNGNALANSSMSMQDRTSGTLLFDINDRQVAAGEIFEVTLTADQAVLGYQLTLNTHNLEVLEVTGLEMKPGNFAVFAPEHALTTSWDLPEGAPAINVEFKLRMRAMRSGQLSELLTVSSRITQAVAYRNVMNDLHNPEVLKVALRYHNEAGVSIQGLDFELYQNVPNPFFDKTTIGFYLPDAGAATVTVYDGTGKLVYQQQGEFPAGYSAITINGQLAKTSGVLYYKLETANNMATRRMIQAK